MSTREKAPTIDTRRVQAEGRLRVIRNALTVADEELAAAYAAKDWEAFGLASWAAYCAELLPELQHIKLRAPVRRERAAKLLELGASRRDLAAAAGCDVATAHRDALVIEGRAVANATPTPLPREVVEECTAWQLALRHVARAGATGLTCLEFEGETGRRHGAASAAFHACERKGFVRRDGRFRGSYAVYVSA